MNATTCLTWLLIAGSAAAAQPTNESPAHKRVQTVIDQVEKTCLEGPVYMIGPKKAQRLAGLVREAKPRLVVECGTALGYSGLWIGRELQAAGRGRLISIELSPDRVRQAEANFRKAGLDKIITVRQGDAREVVKKLEGPIDFLFIDCGYSNYHPILTTLEGKLSDKATVVADNVGIGARGMKDYLDHVRLKYKSRTEWFDLKLPWAKRDAMEISVAGREQTQN